MFIQFPLTYESFWVGNCVSTWIKFYFSKCLIYVISTLTITCTHLCACNSRKDFYFTKCLYNFPISRFTTAFAYLGADNSRKRFLLYQMYAWFPISRFTITFAYICAGNYKWRFILHKMFIRLVSLKILWK